MKWKFNRVNARFLREDVIAYLYSVAVILSRLNAVKRDFFEHLNGYRPINYLQIPTSHRGLFNLSVYIFARKSTEANRVEKLLLKYLDELLTT